jgi:hypothetical protein
VKKGHVYVEAFTASGERIKDQPIVVVDAKGKKLLEGKTDQEGNFNFGPPIKDNMKILLLIENSQRAEFEITKEDFLKNQNHSQ